MKKDLYGDRDDVCSRRPGIIGAWRYENSQKYPMMKCTLGSMTGTIISKTGGKNDHFGSEL